MKPTLYLLTFAAFAMLSACTPPLTTAHDRFVMALQDIYTECQGHTATVTFEEIPKDVRGNYQGQYGYMWHCPNGEQPWNQARVYSPGEAVHRVRLCYHDTMPCFYPPKYAVNQDD